MDPHSPRFTNPDDFFVEVEHDYACPVCWKFPAQLRYELGGVFGPCEHCAERWEIRRIPWRERRRRRRRAVGA